VSYECKTRPDDFDLRKATNARPKSPVPSRIRDEGSGVGVSKVITPPVKVLESFARPVVIVALLPPVLKESTPELAMKPLVPKSASRIALTLSTVNWPEKAPVLLMIEL
jgi:hypothetical protein